jgi:hypothetical protein
MLDGLMRQIAPSKLFSFIRFRHPPRAAPETKRLSQWQLLDGREPGWHRVGAYGFGINDLSAV